MSEQVMVVATELLRPFLTAKLIRDDSAWPLLDFVAERHTFIDRPRAERSPEWRQIIPYVVIRHGDDVFTVRRTAKQTEKRLHHMISIGIGGHINPGHTIIDGLNQELGEEVRIGGRYELHYVGMINDESTEVGRVHLGALFLLDSTTRDVAVVETEKMHGEWKSRAQLARLRKDMETWSRIVYDEILA
ncbi:MAG TPA: NUDIX domain-containing protein [Thermoanaerobaculia bacterium]|nr:NUDIX domain-containing protein [Thermoanaerobaculia bacterium]